MTRHILYFSIIVSLYSCASQTSPGGGPMDTIPPTLVQSVPKHAALNQTVNEIELEFDEYIKTDNPKEQIIITPRTDIEYEIKYRKDKVIIEFEEKLPDSTTYTFNFREAVKDITERNPTDNLKLAFSTGPYLDSLSITGSIIFLLSQEPAYNATVALYTKSDTVDILTGPPLYLTKTDKEGLYSFENLKNDSYYIYAFIDNNKNLTTQPKSEAYGFLSELIELSTNIDSLDLPIQNLDVRDFKLQSARSSGTVFNLKYNKYIQDYTIYNTDSAYNYRSYFTDSEQHTIKIFNNGDIADSLLTYITATDTLLNSILDTVFVKFPQNKRKPQKLTTDLKLEPVYVQNRTVNAQLTFNKPIQIINYDSIFIYIDSLHIFPLGAQHTKINKFQNQYDFSYQLEQSLFDKPKEQKEEPEQLQEQEPVEVEIAEEAPDTERAEQDSVNTAPPPELKPHIYFGSSSFISVEQDTANVLQRDLSFVPNDRVGLIIINITTAYPSFEIQLLDNRNNVVESVKNLKSFQLKNIEPGEYFLRVLVDENEDGLWNPGNINDKLEPEPVYFYESAEGVREIVIRANWEYATDPWTF